MSISELVGYESESDSFSFVEVFRWDAVTDTFEFIGNMNSYLLEQRIAVKRGFPDHKKRQIYAELERRVRILRRLHEQKVTGFYELLAVLAKAQREGLFNKGLLSLDLLSHLSYMSAIATTGVPRGVVFEEASRLPYVSSRYFSDVSVLCGKLNYDCAEACQLVGKTVQEEEAKSLLLRLSNSLSAGEPEMDFLNREAHVQAESYGNEYERQLESTKKWTDSYVALIVSAALIIIVAVISLMIYQVGITFILSLAGLTIAVTMAGSWIISRAAPQETKTHSLPELLRGQRIARVNFKVMLTLVVIAGALLVSWGCL